MTDTPERVRRQSTPHRHYTLNLAARCTARVGKSCRGSGLIHEKYNVEDGVMGAGGEYEYRTGFDWTDGVTAELLDTYCFER